MDNLREAQARDVINAWVGDGYPLRYVIVEALLAYKTKEALGYGDLNSIEEKLQDLISSLDKEQTMKHSNATLSVFFLDAVKQSARSGVRAV